MYDSETPVLRDVNYRARRDVTVEYVRRVLSPGGRVLDLGCGTAPVLSLLRKEGISCSGIDVAEDMVRRARERLRSMGLDDGDLQRGDCCHTPYADASFDVVVCLGVISYVENYTVVLEEINRVLKPGGYAFISFRNQFNPILWDPVRVLKTIAKKATGTLKPEPYAIGRFMDFRDFRDQMRKCAFQYRDFVGIGFGPVHLNRRAVFSELTSIRLSRTLDAALGRRRWKLPARWLSDVSLWIYQKADEQQ
jgi:ubiquinone/menaquinone biosynthesis C-methylase UbiE